MTSDKTEKWEDGDEYPIVEVEISSESHPFYTGKQRIMDSQVASSASTHASATSKVNLLSSFAFLARLRPVLLGFQEAGIAHFTVQSKIFAQTGGKL